MSKKLLSPKRNKDACPFSMTGTDKKIYLEPKIGQQIFIYGEYLKRKFYLDCNYARKNGQYTKNHNRYVPIIFSDYIDLQDRFESILDIHLKSGVIFIDNSPIYQRAFHKNKNIYKLIKYLHKVGYRLFRRKIKFLESQKAKSKFLQDIYKNNTTIDNNFFLSPYHYERIIWTMSDFERMNLAKSETDFGVYAQYFYSSFEMSYNSGTYRLYDEIIKKYHLYLTDLISLISSQNIIKSEYSKIVLPRFIDLPKLFLDHHLYKDSVYANYNPLNNKLSLSLDIRTKNSIEKSENLSKIL